MKYLKTFEDNKNEPDYIIQNTGKYVTIILRNVLDYLNINSELGQSTGEIILTESNYKVNLIDFLKEIFLNKIVEFKTINKKEYNPIIIKKIKNIIGTYSYSYDIYLNIMCDDDNIYIIDIDHINKIYNYDAYKKPLHNEVKFKKEAEKYNL